MNRLIKRIAVAAATLALAFTAAAGPAQARDWWLTPAKQPAHSKQAPAHVPAKLSARDWWL